MNPATVIALKAGIDFLTSLWANLERKPSGWKPTVEDWNALEKEVTDATPEARFLLAQMRAQMFSKSTGQSVTDSKD